MDYQLARNIAMLDAMVASTRHDSTLCKDVASLILEKEFHPGEIIGGENKAAKKANAEEFRKLLVNALHAPDPANFEWLGRHVLDMAIETLEGEF